MKSSTSSTSSTTSTRKRDLSIVLAGAVVVLASSFYVPFVVQVVVRLLVVVGAVGLAVSFFYASYNFESKEITFVNGYLSDVFWWGGVGLLSFGGPAFVVLFMNRDHPLYNVVIYLVGACLVVWLLRVLSYKKHQG